MKREDTDIGVCVVGKKGRRGLNFLLQGSGSLPREGSERKAEKHYENKKNKEKKSSQKVDIKKFLWCLETIMVYFYLLYIWKLRGTP